MAKQKDETAKFIQVLEYFDGPQAVLLERSADIKLVAVAIEKAGYVNPFFAASISYDQWERYRRGYVDFRFLFMFPRWKEWYFFDLINSENDSVYIYKTVKNEDADRRYIPASGFFSYDHSEQIISEMPHSLATQKYKTDGIWALHDFTQFYNKLNDLYSFFIALKTYAADTTAIDRKRRIREAFHGHPLRGGSSYNNVYSDLASIQSFDDKIAIGRLQYASPGEVDVKGRFDVFGEIAVAYNELAKDYDGLKLKYTTIYKYMSRNHLLRNDRARYDPESPISKHLLEMSTEFASKLHLSDVSLIIELTENDALIFSKILLSYFRRLERYFMFFAEGRVKEPELQRGVGGS